MQRQVFQSLNEMNVAELPTSRECYSYSDTSVYYFCFGTLVVFGLIFMGAGMFSSDSGAWPLVPGGAFIAGFFLFILKIMYSRRRPVELDEVGISAVIFRDRRKTIFWPNVKRIERIRGHKSTDIGWRYGYSFVIVGEEYKIIIEDKINGLSDLLNSLNACVRYFHIPLVAFDRTDEAKEKIRATVKDKQLRKKLLFQGAESEISELKPIDEEK